MKLILHIRKQLAEQIALSRNFKPLLSIELDSRESIEETLGLLNPKDENPPRVTKGMLIAFGLINRAFIKLLDKYESKINPIGFIRAFTNFQTKLNYQQRSSFIAEFVERFASGNSEMLKRLLLTNKTAGKEFIKDLILFYLENKNDGAVSFKDFFDKRFLKAQSTLENIFAFNKEFFQNEPPFEDSSFTLIDFLEQPILNHPNSLFEQLDFIKNNWTKYLDGEFLNEILTATDILKEEKIVSQGQGGPPPSIAPVYMQGKEIESLKLYRSEFDLAEASTKLYEESVNFSPDVDWMPNVVMIAKNAFVWLHQLSKKYNRKISRLDEIPAEELEWLSSLGINAIWLIGIWQRSSASKKIKSLMGNPDAIGSAYSLYDYIVAKELGGEEALRKLKENAVQKQIRLASDMVPNHTGIYSDWIENHPEYFIQLPKPPFSDYSFNGPNLSDDDEIEIKIEDGYWDRTNAAVVFRRKDLRTGETTYIYHGNDGTKMPWNDTAQLDMLKSEVREAVIQKILQVAGKFPIIRFDAAMTLTKLHFQRLWYPKPGTGGDIPSRAEHSLTEREFNKLFPREFWREVVDRIKKEKPNTLLLAEAFWLMEGYFVRTLGMHRVYNSAFMHMMMNEENEKYHKLISNTLEFEPEILKRYVNFMSNPDEETAIKQFGTGDKYFGVLTLMVTLPGLPLFAHGQIEGFTEKYGMEYSKSYYEEEPNQDLIKRFQSEISPLLSMRKLFSEVENFWFYETLDNHNNINFNVFAFTNKFNGKKALVLFNNKYDRASGRISNSVSKLIKNNKRVNIVRTTLAKELDIKAGGDYYYIARDVISKKEILLSGSEINDLGFPVKLNGFQYLVLTDFEEIYDRTGEFRQLYERLNLSLVKNISEQLHEIQILPIQDAFLKIFDDSLIAGILFPENISALSSSVEDSKSVLFNRIREFGAAVRERKNIYLPKEMLLSPVRKLLDSIEKLNSILNKYNGNGSNPSFANQILRSVKITPFASYRENSLLLLLNCLLSELVAEGVNIKKLKLQDPLHKLFARMGKGNSEIILNQLTLTVIKSIEEFLDPIQISKSFDFFKDGVKLNKKRSFQLFKKIRQLIEAEEIKRFLAVNKYKRNVYFRKENFEDLVDWYLTIFAIKEIETLQLEEKYDSIIVESLKYKFELSRQLKELAELAGFKYWRLKSLISKLKYFE